MWKNEEQQPGGHRELYFVLDFIAVPCQGVKIQHGGITSGACFIEFKIATLWLCCIFYFAFGFMPITDEALEAVV
jgi:hypothetical protein